ncbi:MAG: TolC family protein [Prevotellaceae bacterium]|jgi:outer membrane protein TolC|nr:TolC family protein [Prevotellaceae bacterium]
MKHTLLIILLMAFAAHSKSQVVMELNLKQAIEIAADSSLQAFIAKNLYLASHWEFRSYKASRLPSLNLDMTPLQYYRDITRRYDSDNNIDIYREQQSLYSSGGLSIQQNVDITGGTFFVDSDLTFMRNFGDNTYTQYTSVPIRVGYSQSLFGFNSFKWERKIEPLKYEKAKKTYLYERESISEEATEYFFDLATAQAEYDMAKENIVSTDSLYRIGEERFKIMSIPQSDLMTLRLDALNARNSLKTAEIDLKRAMFALASFLNLEENVQIRLKLPEVPAIIDIPVNEALLQAKENNPDYLEYKQSELEAERDIDEAKKSVFNVSLYASIGFNQVADNFRKAYKDPSRQDIITIGLSVPIIDWGVRKGKVNMAQNNLNVARISGQQKARVLNNDIIMTLNDFGIQKDLIQSVDEAMDIAIIAYNSTKERFKIGKADLSALTLSLNRHKEAQQNYISALKNYWLSYYKIRKLTLFDFEKREKLGVEFDGKYGL